MLMIIFEGVLTTLPVALIFLLCLMVMKRQEWIFPLAFLSGIILDVFSFRPIGFSSLFFVTFLFLILLYQRKYETATMPFVIIASFFGSIGYLLLMGESGVLIQGVVSTVIAATAFAVYTSLNRTSADDGFQRV